MTAATLRRWTVCVVALAALPLACGAADTAGTHPVAPMSCATAAVPDASFSDTFTVDTGASGIVGANYGQSSCPNQYLVDVALTSSVLATRSLFVSGRWSTTLPADPCDEVATLTVFAFDGSAWKTWDVVPYGAMSEGTICHEEALSHTDPGSAGLGGTSIPTGQGLTELRVAVNALEGTAKVPVFVAGD